MLDAHETRCAMASGTPTAKPVLFQGAGIQLPTGVGYDVVQVLEVNAVQIALAPDCREQLTALVTKSDAGATPPPPHPSTSCNAAPFGGGELVVFVAAVLALRRTQRRW